MTRNRLLPTAAGVVLASLLVALPARSVAAQPQTRNFTVCFTSGVQSCSWLELTTNAALSAGGTRLGTDVQVLVRHNEGSAFGSAITSALSSFFFSYAGASAAPMSGATVSDASTSTVSAVGGAPTPGTDNGWQFTAASSTTASLDNYLSFLSVRTEPSPSGRLWSQYVGGCGVSATGGAINATWDTDIWTCGSGQYLLTAKTEAWFDANSINTVGVSTAALFAGSNDDVAAYCNVTLDEPGSLGDDGSFNFDNVCAAASPATPGTTVPEPSTFALLASALIGVVAVRRRARSAS